ncbi:MAG: hypothetical protein EA001_03455 [Oscillatoriales cyanobacterium]|nr:MAG: hypothetical protein EA001_03455 [Oscillatoriales cyanobacterium]
MFAQVQHSLTESFEVKQLHHKTARFLTESFDVILLPSSWRGPNTNSCGGKMLKPLVYVNRGGVKSINFGFSDSLSEYLLAKKYRLG